jgi:hypothetical protein
MTFQLNPFVNRNRLQASDLRIFQSGPDGRLTALAMQKGTQTGIASTCISCPKIPRLKGNIAERDVAYPDKEVR